MSLAGYLIDANLPRYFRLWSGPEFVFAHDLGPEWSDARLWDYAQSRGLTIVTKDADFRLRLFFGSGSEKVVHVRFGNLRMKEFASVVESQWPEIVALLATHRLVEVFADRVVASS